MLDLGDDVRSAFLRERSAHRESRARQAFVAACQKLTEGVRAFEIGDATRSGFDNSVEHTTRSQYSFGSRPGVHCSLLFPERGLSQSFRKFSRSSFPLSVIIDSG